MHQINSKTQSKELINKITINRLTISTFLAIPEATNLYFT